MPYCLLTVGYSRRSMAKISSEEEAEDSPTL